jgi:hypothetical protein
MLTKRTPKAPLAHAARQKPLCPLAYAPRMFLVTDTEAAAIRANYEQEGEFSAAIELRRLFPGVTDNAKARAHVRSIPRVEAAAADA